MRTDYTNVDADDCYDITVAIHQVLDGQDTECGEAIEQIGEILTKHGLTIHEPGYYDEGQWYLGAHLYFDGKRDETGTLQIHAVTVMPFQDRFMPSSEIGGLPATDEEVNEALFRFMEDRRVPRSKAITNDVGQIVSVVDDSLYMLSWEG